MGLMQFDGITFDNVEDLIRYKKSLQDTAKRQETGQENKEKPAYQEQNRFSDEQEYNHTEPKKVFIHVKRKTKKVSDYHDLIKEYYATRLTETGRITHKAMKSLVRQTGFRSDTIKWYATEHKLTHFRGKRSQRQSQPKTLKPKYTKFSDYEMDYLKENYKNKSVGDMAEFLERPYMQVYNVIYNRITKGRLYMHKKKAALPETYDQKMIKVAEGHREKPLDIYPLTTESKNTLKIMLLDAKERGNPITYTLARSNLSLLDGREWSLGLWNDVCQQIMRSKAISEGLGLSVVFNPKTDEIKVK